MNLEMYPFDRPTNYNEMLNKIGISSFLFALGLTWIAAICSPAINSFLRLEQAEVEVLTLKIPLLFVVPAAFLAVLFRVIRLHDAVSTLFAIRLKFDVEKILIPLSDSVGLARTDDDTRKLRAYRDRAMAGTFYKYASFEEPQISKALVLSAIDQWTWYWILLEFLVLELIVFVVLLCVHTYLAASIVFGTFALLLALFLTFWTRCGDTASKQVQEILGDQTRRAAVRTVLKTIFLLP